MEVVISGRTTGITSQFAGNCCTSINGVSGQNLGMGVIKIMRIRLKESAGF
jgi:hypothetical protein